MWTKMISIEKNDIISERNNTIPADLLAPGAHFINMD